MARVLKFFEGFKPMSKAISLVISTSGSDKVGTCILTIHTIPT